MSTTEAADQLKLDYDQTTDLIVKLLGLANLPVLRGSRKRVLGLVRSIAEGSW